MGAVLSFLFALFGSIWLLGSLGIGSLSESAKMHNSAASKYDRNVVSCVLSPSLNLRQFVWDIEKDPRYNDGIKRRIEQYYAENKDFCEAIHPSMSQIGGDLWSNAVVRLGGWSFCDWLMLTLGYIDDSLIITQIAVQGKYFEAGAPLPSSYQTDGGRNLAAKTIIEYGGVPILGGGMRCIPDTQGARYDAVKYNMIRSDWDCIRELRKLKSK